MSGIAILTIVRSSRVMKNPSETASSTAHGFPRNFVTVLPLLLWYGGLITYLGHPLLLRRFTVWGLALAGGRARGSRSWCSLFERAVASPPMSTTPAARPVA